MAAMRSASFTRLARHVQWFLGFLWLALMLSVAMYVVIAYVRSRELEPAAISTSLLVILSSMAALAAVLAMVLPRWMLSDTRMYIVPFAATALVLMALQRPNLESILARGKRLASSPE